MLELWIKILDIFYVSIVVNHCHKWQIMSLANTIIIMVMSWSYLHSTLNKLKSCLLILHIITFGINTHIKKN